jgi:Xaa-Pro aminopeptidase
MNMLSSESDATYSFQGMKRRLGLHQEKLTRILKRLEDDNLVLKTDEGYKVLHQSRKSTRHLDDGEPVIRGQLPPGIDAVVLTAKLKGRWFKNFRWLGYSTNESGQSLYWITEDGRFQLIVRLGPAEILVWSQPTNEFETRSAVAAGYELFDRISRILPETEDNS